MSRSRFATPLMLTLTAAGTFGLAASQAGIVDLPAGYGLIEDAAILIEGGRIVQSGSFDSIAANPATPYVHELLGDVS